MQFPKFFHHSGTSVLQHFIKHGLASLSQQSGTMPTLFIYRSISKGIKKMVFIKQLWTESIPRPPSELKNKKQKPTTFGKEGKVCAMALPYFCLIYRDRCPFSTLDWYYWVMLFINTSSKETRFHSRKAYLSTFWSGSSPTHAFPSTSTTCIQAGPCALGTFYYPMTAISH